MKWKTTWLVLILAAVLLAFILLVERHSRPTSATGTPPPRLLTVQPAQVTNVQLRLTNELILRAERSDGQWSITSPIFYPAQSFAIEQLLQRLSQSVGQNRIPLDELAPRQQTLADFGLDVPLATLTLQHPGQPPRTEIYFGRKTPVGDHVYLRANILPDIYLVETELFDRLPQHASGWRDPALLDITRLRLDRMEVRTSSGTFEIRTDPPKRPFFLSKPIVARVDVPKIQNLLRIIQNCRVVAFVTDDPRAELEPYGLQPPEAELTFGLGTNDLVVVQFGKCPTNAPHFVYARRLAQTNVVLISKDVLDALRIPPNELRDRRLLAFNPAEVNLIEVKGPEDFSARRQTNDTWLISATPPYTGDPDTIQRWITLLSALEGVVEKDIVTDFAHYGLAEPLRQYILKSATNAAPDRTVDQLDIGARDPDRVFARRASENSVYAISRADFNRLPAAPWQLRDRLVWSFTTNQVKSVTVRRKDLSRRIVRNNTGAWSLAPGSTGIINPHAINETLYRLGQLRAEAWVDQGPDRKSLYGFTPDGYQLTLELQAGETIQTFTLEFGGMAPSDFPYALATAEGKSWIFEFPVPLFVGLMRDLSPPSSEP